MKCQGCDQEKEVLVIGDARLCVKCITASVQLAQQAGADIPLIGIERVDLHIVRLTRGKRSMTVSLLAGVDYVECRDFFS